MRDRARECDGADDEIRTRDIQLGKLNVAAVSAWNNTVYKTGVCNSRSFVNYNDIRGYNDSLLLSQSSKMTCTSSGAK